jgi:hypothetical protein
MPSIFNRNTSRHKSKFSGNRKRNRARAKAAAGGIRAGFPIDEPFKSIEAVRDYLSGDRITCLICGNDKKALGNHLRMHGMTADDYKAKYSIPFDYGLSGADLIAKQSAEAKERVAAGKGFHGMSPEERAAISARAKTAPRRDSPGKRMMTSERNSKYADSDFYRVLTLMRENDISAEDVMARFDVPGKCVFYQKVKKDPAFKSALDAAYESLSFQAQARAQRLGANFRQEAHQLRLMGLSYKQIGERLGVDTMSIFNHLNGRVSGEFLGKTPEKWSERLDSNQRPLSPQETDGG